MVPNNGVIERMEAVMILVLVKQDVALSTRKADRDCKVRTNTPANMKRGIEDTISISM